MRDDFLRATAALVLIVTATGCGDDEFGRRYKVYGTVTFRSEPVESGLITFDPVERRAPGSQGGRRDHPERVVHPLDHRQRRWSLPGLVSRGDQVEGRGLHASRSAPSGGLPGTSSM